ncbi:hypothetical protein ASD08_35650 [Streptomyces sp. Root369]|nr:hypothetical protein ASD08_35650 [Streptomyces sp. Root369]
MAATDQCIILSGFADRPRVPLNGEMMHASRAVWTIRHGDPGERHVLHTCHRGEEGCISIRHLYLGDNARNIRDMVAAGRSTHGERNANAVLSGKQAQAIRDAYVPRVVTQRMLAAAYGVSQQTISDIVRGKLWNHGHVVDLGRRKSGE